MGNNTVKQANSLWISGVTEPGCPSSNTLVIVVSGLIYTVAIYTLISTDILTGALTHRLMASDRPEAAWDISLN